MSLLTRENYVSAARARLAQNIHEEPAHSNRTVIGVIFNWNGVPWCAETVCVILLDVAGTWIVKSASVAQLISWAKAGKYGLRWIPRDRIGEGRPGMAVTFDWHLHDAPGNANNFHISSLVDPGTWVTRGLAGKANTIGGNENDAITDQWRDGYFVQGLIDFPFVDAPGAPTPTPAPPTARRDTLRHGESLQRGQELVSANGRFHLALQASDGHLVLYDNGRAVWSLSTFGATQLSMQDDDNLVTYAGAHPLWETNTAHKAGREHSRFVVQDDRNLVIYTDSNRAIWSSGTSGR